MNDPHSNNFYEVHSSVYSIVLNKRRPYVYLFWIFFQAHSLIKGPTFIIFWNFFLGLRIFSSVTGFFNITLHLLCMPYVYSRPFVYSFWQIFQTLPLFPALRLFRTLEYLLPLHCNFFILWRAEISNNMFDTLI